MSLCGDAARRAQRVAERDGSRRSRLVSTRPARGEDVVAGPFPRAPYPPLCSETFIAYFDGPIK